MQAPGKFSITPVTAAVTAALYPGYAALAQDQDAAQSRALEEIVVTARKRTESIQDIPAAIQAISQESLAAMGAKGLEDYARFVPSVNVVNYGPGSNTVVFRGAITGAGYLGQATSSVYLDEISVSQTGTQPNIRPVDIARVEALSGPQGTLYGSDAQAGTMRVITNQPVLNQFEAVFDGELRGGDKSDMSYRGSLVFNVPLVEDKLALRVAGYNDHDGGFIDNVFGHTADWYGLEGENKAPDPTGTDLPWGSLDNSQVLEERWNDADVTGGRIHLLWQMNDSWSATLSYHNQRTKSGADNYYDPYVGDLQVVRFLNEWRDEKFNMGSLKIEGDVGFAQLVAAVSYYERDIKYLRDITTYAHYWSAQYCHDSTYQPGDPILYQGNPTGYYAYGWVNPDTGFIVGWPVYCHGTQVNSDFFNTARGSSHDDKLTAELRMSHTGDSFDWIVGLYHEQSVDSWISPFASPTMDGNARTITYQDSVSLNFWEQYWSNYYIANGGSAVTYPDAEAQWWSESHTDWDQSAVFGELSWHITDDWEMTVGGRYFHRSNTNFYFVNHPGGPNYAGEPDNTAGDREYRLAHNGRPAGRSGDENWFVPKLSLSYNVSDKSMVYGLYSRGVRQGGVNRSRGEPFFPNTYDSDVMDNYELGFKSSFGEGRGRLNLTAYNMKWSDYQLELVDPTDPPCRDENGVPLLPETEFNIPGVCGQPWQVLIANAGDAHINGANIEVEYAAGDNWILGGNFEKMEAETDTSADLDGPDENTGEVTYELVKGLRLPYVPSSKASGWIEFHNPTQLFGANEFFIRTQWSYTGDSYNVLEPRDPLTHPNPRVKSPSYTIGDLRAGIIGNDWQLDFFVNNLTDERAEYTTQTGQFEWTAAQTVDGREHHKTIFTNRPREFGIRYMKRWGD